MNVGRPRIVVVGSSNTDLVVRSPHLPAPGETVLASSFSQVQGGKGANQAVAAARLGAHVTLVARVGTDSYGDAAIAAFEVDGINTNRIARDGSETSGVAIIGVDETTGENSILVISGSNGRLSVEDIENAAAEIESADVLVCQLEVPLDAVQAALKIARKAGVRTILNPSPYQELDEEVLRLVTVLVPNEGEALLLAGVSSDTAIALAGQKLRALGTQSVLITLGKRGSMLIDEGGETEYPGFAVAAAVDTTGAGDCFAGAFAVALAENQTMPDAIRFASAAAAISVTRAGAQPSLPTREEVTRRLL